MQTTRTTNLMQLHTYTSRRIRQTFLRSYISSNILYTGSRYKEIDFILLIYIYLCSMIGRMTHFQDRFQIDKLKVGTGSLLDLLIRYNRGFTPGDDSIENPSSSFERIEKPLYSSCILSFYTNARIFKILPRSK